jgi:hypothetical protein
LDLVWFVGTLAWATHIASDRVLGFGPRTRKASSTRDGDAGVRQQQIIEAARIILEAYDRDVRIWPRRFDDPALV